MIETSWNFIKNKINIPKNYIEYEGQYLIYTISEPLIFYTNISKINNSQELEDFENNFKNILKELSYCELSYPEVLSIDNANEIDITGISWDLLIDKNRFLFGGYIITNENINFGDYLVFQVIDKDNILGYGAGVILAEYIKRRYIKANDKNEIKMSLSQLKLIYEGLYLRLKLKTTATNYKLCCGYYFYEY
ncbi:MAG: hypothetical protein SNJ64_04165 [Endomicrobiia bacterium]